MPNPGNNPNRKPLMAPLNDALAGGLCDVHQELLDLKHVVTVCEQLKHRQRQPERSRNKNTEWALWESAVISYGSVRYAV